ncbi:MAG: leucyl aminopeptidase [Deltaproteobacteria bacterium]|nr:leucyl aminopeptidase [Deltaproteobacteria bacterium]
MQLHIDEFTLKHPGVLAIGLNEGAARALPPSLAAAFGGELERLLDDQDFKGKAGVSVTTRALGRVAATHLVFVGQGSGSVADLRLAAGAVGHFAREQGVREVSFAPAGALSEPAAEAIVEGLITGNYRYDRFFAESARKAAIERFVVLSPNASLAALETGRVLGQARSVARDLVNAPAADIYPETLAAFAAGLASERVSVDVWDEVKVRDAGMGGITAVGQGSDRKPRFVHMVYRPAGKSRGEIALVGKGVTFDSGGLSIKPTDGMLTMRCDMGGAGAVIGVMSALEALNLPITVHGIFAAAENMISGNSYKLGDILTILNGKTVEVLNTDAEGRLLLADCLSYASKLPVSHVVDLATLTGAAVVALGEHYTAMYADDDALAAALSAAAAESGEGFWRMPLEPLYKELIKGEVGQLKNVGGRLAGSITAALFLQEFVDGPKWSHLDIAGPAFLGAPERHLVKGATGAGVPALLAWLRAM